MPGPIIAKVAPRTATMIAVNECAEQVKNTQTPTMAIVAPATGVQSRVAEIPLRQTQSGKASLAQI